MKGGLKIGVTHCNPQAVGSSWTAVTLILPRLSAWLFVSVFIAALAILNPAEPVSIAKILIDLPVPAYFTCQHDPQELDPCPVMAGAPPMFGKPGS